MSTEPIVRYRYYDPVALYGRLTLEAADDSSVSTVESAEDEDVNIIWQRFLQIKTKGNVTMHSCDLEEGHACDNGREADIEAGGNIKATSCLCLGVISAGGDVELIDSTAWVIKSGGRVKLRNSRAGVVISKGGVVSKNSEIGKFF